MNLSNQNICNLQGAKCLGGGGVQIISEWVHPPRKSVPENTNCKICVNKSIKVNIM